MQRIHFGSDVRNLRLEAQALGLPAGWTATSWLLRALLVARFSLLLLAKFCVGAHVFPLRSGEAAFANRTLPG